MLHSVFENRCKPRNSLSIKRGYSRIGNPTGRGKRLKPVLVWVRISLGLIEDGQIGKAPGSELGNFTSSNLVPRIKKAKAVPILYNLGFLFYTARFFFYTGVYGSGQTEWSPKSLRKLRVFESHSAWIKNA